MSQDSNDISFILDTMTWSYSRLTSYDQCKYGWKKQYVDCDEGENNFAAENGLAVHETLEQYLSGKIDLWDCPDYYDKRFAELVTHDAPYNKYTDIGEKTYNECYDYFCNLRGLDPKYEVLGVELLEKFKLRDYNFVGFIDLLLRDRETGEITISDHKSHTFKFLKSGAISKTDLPALENYKRQLYLYAVSIMEKYGRVDYLRWNLFRQQRDLIVPFKKEEFEAAKQWALDTIERIKKESDFSPIETPDYYCRNLCDFRNVCEYSPVNQPKAEEDMRYGRDSEMDSYSWSNDSWG